MSAGSVSGGPARSPIAIQFGEELTFERGKRLETGGAPPS
jgi:hypothetical protein